MTHIHERPSPVVRIYHDTIPGHLFGRRIVHGLFRDECLCGLQGMTTFYEEITDQVSECTQMHFSQIDFYEMFFE